MLLTTSRKPHQTETGFDQLNQSTRINFGRSQSCPCHNLIWRCGRCKPVEPRQALHSVGYALAHRRRASAAASSFHKGRRERGTRQRRGRAQTGRFAANTKVHRSLQITIRKRGDCAGDRFTQSRLPFAPAWPLGFVWPNMVALSAPFGAGSVAASSSQPGRSAWRAASLPPEASGYEPPPQDATPRSALRMSPDDAPQMSEATNLPL
jgi:hypothetical protein